MYKYIRKAQSWNSYFQCLLISHLHDLYTYNRWIKGILGCWRQWVYTPCLNNIMIHLVLEKCCCTYARDSSFITLSTCLSHNDIHTCTCACTCIHVSFTLCFCVHVSHRSFPLLLQKLTNRRVRVTLAPLLVGHIHLLLPGCLCRHRPVPLALLTNWACSVLRSSEGRVCTYV